MRLHSEWALPNIIGGNQKINREGGSQSRFEAKTAMDAPVKIPEASLPGPLSAASPRPTMDSIAVCSGFARAMVGLTMSGTNSDYARVVAMH